MDDELSPMAKAVLYLVAAATVVYSLWATVIAFAGGSLPILGIELDGGLGLGLLWVVIVDPLVITVGYWIGLLLAMPIQAMANRK